MSEHEKHRGASWNICDESARVLVNHRSQTTKMQLIK
jgi:hypothetical protein